MGDWNITIRGTGAHHNVDYPRDANRMARRFCDALREAGHTVREASITHGGEEVLVRGGQPEAYGANPAHLAGTPGERAFAKFYAKSHEVTGTTAPTWEQTPESARACWEAAAAAVLAS